MRFIVTLNNVKRSDLESLGFRAVDLGVLREKRLNIPLTFVVNNQAYEEFMRENGLHAKIEKLSHNKSTGEVYKQVLRLFNDAPLPKDVEEELFDAYQSLSIDPGATASTIVSDWDYPFVSVFRSPAFLLDTDDEEGLMQNIIGREALVKALKEVWASYFSSASVAYRKSSDIGSDFTTGVIVQKIKRIKQSAVSYYHSGMDKGKITVKGYFGLPDYDFDEEILGKDTHGVDVDSLMVEDKDIKVQEFSIVRDADSGKFNKHELKEAGSRQKLDDKQVYEIARVTKRARSFIGKDIKLYLGVRDAYTYVCLPNRIVASPKRISEEKEEIDLSVDGGGARIIEHTHEVVASEEEVPGIEMPEIISKQEADKEVRKEKCEEVLEQEEVESFEEAMQEVVEHEIQKEVNLLQEVLGFKEIIERMEEHALNENKEEYSKEARKLIKLIGRVKEE